jgi:hypothetical protein
LVDFAIDGLEHVSGELGSYVAQGSIDLLWGLSENLTELLCAAGTAFRV